ncbi:glycosyltransferase involved in cell wall biosynthesis [Sphingomonas kaistensis]|uniref:Glycosyltransferase involved in cell wall biosynthesis n=1 Tax=Sphingomonas kaistensis TaxID=298708 RepID=A0A7X5Y3H5_9SPHN|nr:glycosyltransferase family 4 protein [Sphingomonas kaistensis]NJC04484.1 glycosyltransferase involved in cell wall biosynthesis [Sphingomonas kaistensis]
MTVRIAYLTSQYPGPSHTFIRREVSALRAIDVDIQTFSIRVPPAVDLNSPVDQAEAVRTFFVLGQSPLTFLGAHLGEAVRRPIRTLRTLLLALRHRPPGIKSALLSLAHFAEAIVLAGELRRRRIGHLHNHFANSGATVGMLASHQVGIPWSFTIHGISEFDYPAGLLLADKIAASKFVACVSLFGRAQAFRVVEGGEWSKLTVVHCGLALDELPTPVQTDGPALRLILVGRLSPEKGIGGLLQAISMVAVAERPRLFIVGDGPMRAELDEQVERLGLGDHVTFLGRLSEADTLVEIARSDALVLSSFMEGLPIVLMEAMALGKPVIATRVAGIPELVTDGEDGLLFTPSNWDELAAHIKALASDPALRRRLGAAGPAKIAAEFDIRTSAEALRRLFLQAAPSAATALERPSGPASDTWAASTADRAAGEPAPRG